MREALNYGHSLHLTAKKRILENRRKDLGAQKGQWQAETSIEYFPVHQLLWF